MLALASVLLAVSACSNLPELRPVEAPEAPAGLAEGRRLLEEGRAIEAVSAFRRHLRLRGDDVQALNGLAIAYGELGRSDLAAEMFGRALALEPDDPATLNNIGFSALRRADGRLARHYLEKAQSGHGAFDEIEGNLEGLALLDTIERSRSSRPVLRQAAWHTEDHQPAAVIRLSMPKTRHHQRSNPPKSKTVSTPSGPTLIDFTTVIDPFSAGAAGKQIGQ